MAPRLHDIVVRTSGSDPELPAGLLVDGAEMLIPRGSRVLVNMVDDEPTTVTITLFAGSFRVEPL
jgi:hypothetical protein